MKNSLIFMVVIIINDRTDKLLPFILRKVSRCFKLINKFRLEMEEIY